MKRLFVLMTGSILALSFMTAMDSEAGKKETKIEIRTMPREDPMKVARSAAPSSVSKDASIMVFGSDGKLTEAKKGTNGFTCIPDIDGQEKPDPFCGNGPAMQWVGDLVDGREKPSNTEPGVAYMMQGGWHWEKDGKITMDKNEPGARRVKEPPHWMVFWPFRSADTGLPVKLGNFGTYIMWDSTPYAHLMIYQNPRGLK